MHFSELELIVSYPTQAQNPILVDVGGHYGSVSQVFAKKGWQVLAFEPEPTNRAIFEKTLAHFPKVTCIPKVVSDVTGQKVTFYVSAVHSGIHSIAAFHATHRPAFEAETIRLADALAMNQIEQITILKIDTEGADFLVLQGLEFEHFRPELIMIEFMDGRSSKHFGYTHHDVAHYMSDQGYATFVSAWRPLTEYGRDGQADTNVWLECGLYPLAKAPSWGNLIFVPKEHTQKFETTLKNYLSQRHWRELKLRLRQTAKNVPYARKLYRSFVQV